jgi:hypothetical protein
VSNVLGTVRRRARGALADQTVTATVLPDAEVIRATVLKGARARLSTRRVPVSEARVAVAGSPQVLEGLRWEWMQTDLAPDTWDTSLTADHALLVVEVDPDGVASWPAGTSPAELAAAAAERGVPAVAWVTGGEAADAGSVTGFDAVLPLPPATQPRAQSAERKPGGERPGDVLIRSEASAGEQGAAVDVDLIPALERSAVVAHDWDLSADDAPAPTSRLCAQYRVLADVGRREPARTWPVLDALASRTAVVTTTERAADLAEDLRPVVAVAEDHEVRRHVAVLATQPEYRDRATHLAHRAVLDGHTFADRARALLDAAGAPATPAGPRTVSVVVPTNRPHELDNVLDNVARQKHVEAELIVVAHGIEVDTALLRARARELGIDQLTVVPVPAELTLGAVLNRGLEVAAGAFVAKMDDDNFYGSHFLGDLVDAFSYTSAGITGKWAHYVWLRSSGAVVLRFERYEHTYHRLVQGGSIVARRDVADDIRFSDIPRAVDSDFLNRAMAAGVQTYSGDRYNFISIRGDDRLGHTWKVDDLVFMTGAGRVVTYGDPRELVSV